MSSAAVLIGALRVNTLQHVQKLIRTNFRKPFLWHLRLPTAEFQSKSVGAVLLNLCFVSEDPHWVQTAKILISWLVGCFGFKGSLRQYFSLYRAVSQREGERGERMYESKNVQTTPTCTYCKRNRTLPYS